MQLGSIFTFTATVFYLAIPTLVQSNPHFCEVSVSYENANKQKITTATKYVVPPGSVDIAVGSQMYAVTVDETCKRTDSISIPGRFKIDTQGKKLEGNPTENYIRSVVLQLHHRGLRMVSRPAP
ncbi:uncharacterized protein PgNI_08466 [Pyricularia grisea]|uniref:Uncharacterized protein n=1 Tax=Pyricularia grisea TaxID=148305 RepID=A0A6P8AWW6_PYRGI|nr:uncharacterized protein PgNI_08466 [Pyricularia grisea]TLD06705.1 hypothetical protein PgNI_08466 [Pyricularia grisea]